jgi:hypothetical protein
MRPDELFKQFCQYYFQQAGGYPLAVVPVNMIMEVFTMMAAQFNPDPSDLTQGTIKDLFYRQVRNMTVKPTRQQKMRSFDFQFSDGWF